MDTFAILIGNQVKDTRIEKRLTQSKLAELAGCTRSTISRIEANDRSPSLELAVSIARVLGEPVEKIFNFNFDAEETV